MAYVKFKEGEWIDIPLAAVSYHLNEQGILFSWVSYCSNTKIPENLRPFVFGRRLRLRIVNRKPEYYDGKMVYDADGKLEERVKNQELVRI